mgnify:CR=1 FL=1
MKAASHKLRKGRCSENGRCYHLRFAVRDRAPLLGEFAAARCVVAALRAAHTEACGSTLAFTVMPDHVHWLVQLAAETDLATLARRTKSRAARHVNRAIGRSGPLWQPGFFDRAIRPSEELIGIARYIVRNPVRAGLVTSVRQYSHWDAVWLQ